MKEKILKKIRGRSVAFVFWGVLIALIGAFFLLMTIANFDVLFLIFGAFFLAGGIFTSISASRDLKKDSPRFLKINPDFLELAESLDHPVFENNFIIVSDKAIAPKKNPEKLSKTEDVLGIYESIQSMNGIPVSHTVSLALRNGSLINLNVYAKKKETKDDLLLTIKSYCPNAMVGYSQEMLKYWKTEKKKYKEQLKAQ